MAIYEKAKDIFIQRKKSDGGFEEVPLIVSPNSVVLIDSDNDLIVMPTASFLAGSVSSSVSSSISSSYALTSSFSLNGGSGSPTVSASWASSSISASYALTASFALNGGGSSLTTGSTYLITASWSNNSISSSYSSLSTTASYVATASSAISASYSIRSNNSTSASYASTASWLNSASINVPNGVAGLDGNGNLAATVIPLQDTEANLGVVIIASGASAYATDTRNYFIGNGTSSISNLYSIVKYPTTSSVFHKAYFIPLIVGNSSTSSVDIVVLPMDNSLIFTLFEIKFLMHNNVDGQAYHYNFENSYMFNNDSIEWSVIRSTPTGSNAIANVIMSGSNTVSCIIHNGTGSDLNGFLKVEYSADGIV